MTCGRSSHPNVCWGGEEAEDAQVVFAPLPWHGAAHHHAKRDLPHNHPKLGQASSGRVGSRDALACMRGSSREGPGRDLVACDAASSPAGRDGSARPLIVAISLDGGWTLPQYVVHSSPELHRSGAGSILRARGVHMAGKAKNTIRTSVILPEGARAQIEALAAANDVSAAWVIRHAVLRLLDELHDQTELPLGLPVRRRAVAR